MSEFLFVYGTLRRSLAHPMHTVLAGGSTFIGDATCPGRLFDLGFYPGAVLDDACDARIRGEMYQLADGAGVLAALDRYEGCSADDSLPHEYERVLVDVMAADGTTHRAWVYAYRGPLDQVTKIADGDYAAHCRLIVRAESPTDYDAIDQVNDVAFGGDGESRLIRALRNRADFDSGLSLVAEREGVVIGHILFTSIRIDGEGGSTPAQALAPMAVLPDWQNQGIGSRLVRVGLRMCRERRHGIVVVLGHPKYYPRFGFVPAPPIGIAPPFPVSDDAFMVCALKHGALDNVCGNVCYPREFDDVS